MNSGDGNIVVVAFLPEERPGSNVLTGIVRYSIDKLSVVASLKAFQVSSLITFHRTDYKLCKRWLHHAYKFSINNT